MRLSVTVPQLFYDVIARVLPGFALLFALNAAAPGVTAVGFSAVQGHNVIDSLGDGLGYLALCYLLGWSLKSLTSWIGSFEDSTYEAGRRSKSDRYRDYQWIRFKHPEAGFRIVKLRAEARMLETTRTAMLVVAAACILGIVVRLVPMFPAVTQLSVARLGATIPCVGLAVLAVWTSEKAAWERYWGNVDCIYKLLPEPAPDPEGAAQGRP